MILHVVNDWGNVSCYTNYSACNNTTSRKIEVPFCGKYIFRITAYYGYRYDFDSIRDVVHEYWVPSAQLVRGYAEFRQARKNAAHIVSDANSITYSSDDNGSPFRWGEHGWFLKIARIRVCRH